jgi:creatinine amidohydrolase/Fe(II)-dependent formamide hydrolase-like protein
MQPANRSGTSAVNEVLAPATRGALDEAPVPTDTEVREAFLREARAPAARLGLPTTVTAVTRATLDAADPTGGMRREVAVLSIGNACEAHGDALPPDIDDRTAVAVASRVSGATGARYLGHIPYATDGLGALASAWSPAYLAVEPFYAAVSDYASFLCRHAYDVAGQPRPRLLLIVSGHGGNGVLAERLPRLARDLGAERCLYSLSMRLSPRALAAGHTVQHASDVEHAVARTLGAACLDDQRLAATAAELEHDEGLVSTLREQPALGGMSGYYVFGDARFDAVRSRYPGVKAAVRRFVEGRRIEACAVLGAGIVEHSIRVIAAEVLSAAAEIGVAPPWFGRKGQLARGANVAEEPLGPPLSPPSRSSRSCPRSSRRQSSP